MIQRELKSYRKQLELARAHRRSLLKQHQQLVREVCALMLYFVCVYIYMFVYICINYNIINKVNEVFCQEAQTINVMYACVMCSESWCLLKEMMFIVFFVDFGIACDCF